MLLFSLRLQGVYKQVRFSRNMSLSLLSIAQPYPFSDMNYKNLNQHKTNDTALISVTKLSIYFSLWCCSAPIVPVMILRVFSVVSLAAVRCLLGSSDLEITFV